MKKYMRVCLLALTLLALMALPAFAGYDGYTEDAAVADKTTIDMTVGKDYLNSVSYTTTETDPFLLVVLKSGTVPTEDNILYVDQVAGDGTKVTFNKVYPSVAQTSTVCLAGPGLASPIKLADLKVSGVTVSGQVKSYDPKKATTIQLMKGEDVKYTGTITALSEGSGQLEQSFSIDSVNPDTYDLVVTKAGHLTYTITGVVVGDGGLNLTGNSKDAIKLITLLAGDVDGKGAINETDLNIGWNDANYGQSVGTPGVNATCDINGNGVVNETDLNIVWNDANYGKDTDDCKVAYSN